jgi:hypothetical protein
MLERSGAGANASGEQVCSSQGHLADRSSISGSGARVSGFKVDALAESPEPSPARFYVARSEDELELVTGAVALLCESAPVASPRASRIFTRRHEEVVEAARPATPPLQTNNGR